MQHHHQHYSTSTASEEEIESFFLDSLMKSKCLSEQAEEEEESDEQSEINVITKLTSISTSPTSLSITTTATTTTTTTSSHFAGGLRKKSSMKSSFALTSLLQSEEDKIYSTSGKRGNINTDSNNIEPYNDNLALHTRPEGWSSPQTHFTNQQRQQQHQQPKPLVEATTFMTPQEFGESLQKVLDQQQEYCSMNERHISNSNNDNYPWTTVRESPALRQALEQPLRYARKLRDSRRRIAADATTATSASGIPLLPFPTVPHSIITTLPLPLPPPPPPLTSWVGLPYAQLREERPFLYDHAHTHPLADILRDTLRIDDLSRMHESWNPLVESAKAHQQRIFQCLIENRRDFHRAYESFVTSCCIPLLHATALQKKVFNVNRRTSAAVTDVATAEGKGVALAANHTFQQHSHHHAHRRLSLSSSPSNGGGGGSGGRRYVGNMDPIVYRYQVFPTINVVYPNDPQACTLPICDLSDGMSVGWLHFHVPLTASMGTSALYCESYPGREDWHPLHCKSVGLGYCWDGARNLRFNPMNTTGKTRVSLDFRILLVRASSTAAATTVPNANANGNATNSFLPTAPIEMDDDVLCRPHHLNDIGTGEFGFYEEAVMGTFGGAFKRRRSSGDGSASAVPDARCGFPFT